MTAKWQYKQAYEAAIEEARRLKAENERLTKQCSRLFDKTLELADENARLKESLAESERDGSMAWDRTCKVEAENERLRKVANLCAEYIGDGRCEGCVAKSACNNGDIDCLTRVRLICMMRGLGIEVEP